MANLVVLKAEIDADPLTRGYAAMTDQQVADSLNAVDRDGVIPMAEVFTYLNKQQKIGLIHLVADGVDVGGGPVTLAERAAAYAVIDALLSDAFPFLDLRDGDTNSMFGGFADDLIAAGALVAANKAAVAGMKANRQSRATEIGAGVVRAGEVAMARAV